MPPSPRSRALGALLEDHDEGTERRLVLVLSTARTAADAAVALGVPLRTLHHWLARYPRLRAALVAGREAHGLDSRGYARKAP